LSYICGMKKKAGNKPKPAQEHKQAPPKPYVFSKPEDRVLMVREPAATYVRLTREGFDRRQLQELQDISALDLDTLANLLGINVRTIMRKTDSETFRPETTERMLELLRLYSIGEDTFGNLPAFRSWLASPVPAFGNDPPLSFLDTGFGIRMVATELERINYGVFS
jgi:putative toxin-antitoxin system antitoxin component (TIGR02293 family)